MPQVRIMLAPVSVMREFFFPESKTVPELAKHLYKYTILPPMEVEEEGLAAAAEMFDLTNNPGRQEERLQRYGNGRSLSSCDVVDVDGVRYLCCSIGWAVMP